MALVSMRASDRVRGGRPEHVGSYTRTAPDGRADDRAIGFGGGGSVIFVMRRRDPLGGMEKPQPLEGGGGMSGPSRSFGGSASGRAPSPKPRSEPRFDIHRDVQARHIPRTQTDPRRSALYADPDALIKEFAEECGWSLGVSREL